MTCHWWVARTQKTVGSSGSEEEPETFRIELRTHDGRSIRIEGDRRLFKDTTLLATDEHIGRVGEHIVRAINSATAELE